MFSLELCLSWLCFANGWVEVGTSCTDRASTGPYTGADGRGGVEGGHCWDFQNVAIAANVSHTTKTFVDAVKGIT